MEGEISFGVMERRGEGERAYLLQGEELFRVVDDRVKNVDAGLEDTLMVKVNKKR